MKEILISPHLDDAALSCARRIRSGTVTSIVTVFAGDPAGSTPLSEWDRVTRATSSRDRVSERRAEDNAAWTSVGQEYRHLPYAEADDVIDLGELIDRLRLEMAGADTALIPAGIGAHPHHLLVRQAALAAIQPATMPILYGELPYAAFFGWPSNDGELPDVQAYWHAALSAASSAREEWVAVCAPLSRAEQTWKRALIAHYKSQIGAVSGGSLDLFGRTDLLSREVEFHCVRRG